MLAPPAGIAGRRRGDRDAGRALRRVDLDPAVLAAEREVGALLEPERLVEGDRAVLVIGHVMQTRLISPIRVVVVVVTYGLLQRVSVCH